MAGLNFADLGGVGIDSLHVMPVGCETGCSHRPDISKADHRQLSSRPLPGSCFGAAPTEPGTHECRAGSFDTPQTPGVLRRVTERAASRSKVTGWQHRRQATKIRPSTTCGSCITCGGLSRSGSLPTPAGHCKLVPAERLRCVGGVAGVRQAAPSSPIAARGADHERPH